MKALQFLAKFCAILAGLLLVFITLMTVVSVIGRDTIGKTIVGDFELSGAAAGAAIALFMPWCQCQRGNIMVDFFTTNASDSAKNVMDRFGALVIALMLLLMTWRTFLGGMNAWQTQSGTMMLGFPEWVVYVAMIPPLALAACIALHQTVFGFGTTAEESNPELAV
jgi:TRAP-type C4-dicarboxylate transport system permease small subunit